MVNKSSKRADAARARQRRARRKKELVMLHKEAISESSTPEMRKKYLEEKRLREKFLTKERERVQKYRQQLKKRAEEKEVAAMAKIEITKIQKNLKYRRDKKIGKRNEWNAHSRGFGMMKNLKIQLEQKGKDINGKWYLYQKEKVTPLGAAIRAGHYSVVRLLLNQKANPEIKCSKDITPL